MLYVLRVSFDLTNSSLFYIVFNYSWFIELQLNQYNILLFVRLFIHQVLLFRIFNIPFKIIIQAFLCWFLNCVHHIYWISVHWSWNLSLGVIPNFQWDVSKPDICICFPCRFVEGLGEEAVFKIAPVSINTLIGFN